MKPRYTLWFLVLVFLGLLIYIISLPEAEENLPTSTPSEVEKPFEVDLNKYPPETQGRDK